MATFKKSKIKFRIRVCELTKANIAILDKEYKERSKANNETKDENDWSEAGQLSCKSEKVSPVLKPVQA